MWQALPDRLGDERHSGMQKPQIRVQDANERPPGGLTLGRREALVAQADLGQLHSPVAVLVPDRLIQYLARVTEAVLPHRFVNGPDGRRGARQDPAIGRAEEAAVWLLAWGGGRNGRGSRPPHEASHVPELVGEVAAVLQLLGAESGVVAGCRAVDQGKPQSVGAHLLDRLEWIDGVARGLGHLLAVRVADQA